MWLVVRKQNGKNPTDWRRYTIKYQINIETYLGTITNEKAKVLGK